MTHVTRRSTGSTRSKILTLAMSLALGGGVALAQQPEPPGQMQPADQTGGMTGMVQQADQQISQQLQQWAQDPAGAVEKLFVLHAYMGNQAEIELARAAQQKAQDDQVKQLAQRIVQDHQQANQQLQQIASQMQVQLPQSLPQMKQQELRIFTSLSGEQFDKLFVAHMQANHARDLIKYRTVSQTAQNQQVRQYASQQLPILSQHFESVQQCAVALGLPSGSLEAIPAAGRIEGTGTGRSGEQQPQPNR